MHSGELPKKLEVGEDVYLLFPYDRNCLLKTEWSHVGIHDCFRKTHWAKSQDLKDARKRWLSDFGPKTT